MQTEKPLFIVTVQAAEDLTRCRLVNFAGELPTAGQRVLGVATMNFDSGEQASVAVRGEMLVEAAAAIAMGVEVESDAAGCAVTKTTGVAFGVTRDAATAAGDIIRVLM